MTKMANRLLICTMLATSLLAAAPAHARSGKPTGFVDLVQMFVEFFGGPGAGDDVSDLAQQGPHQAGGGWFPG